MIEVGNISMPPDLPIPEDFVRVIDLDAGGLVSGELHRDETRVYFEPSAVWAEGGRYAWSVLPLERHPHGPQFQFPDHLLGTAVFETSDSMQLLASGVDSIEKRTCMVFSRVLTSSDTGGFVVTVNDVPLDDATFGILEAGDWGLPYALEVDDAGVTVVCFTTASDIEVGARLRVWAGGLGPWNVVLEEQNAEDLMIDLRRANY